MKTTRAGSLSSFTSPLHVVAVQLDLFIRLLFMGRRKKIKYLTRTLFQHTRSRIAPESIPFRSFREIIYKSSNIDRLLSFSDLKWEGVRPVTFLNCLQRCATLL